MGPLVGVEAGMTEFINIPGLVDLVIGFTLLEALALVLLHRVTGKGVAPREFGVNMVSGLCLMLALRSHVQDAGASWIAVFLLAAGIAHVTDLWLRWRRHRICTVHVQGVAA
jgi:hypothetical protein